MVAQRNTASGTNSRVSYHARIQSAAARFLATALQDDLRRGNIGELKTHMSSALEAVEQQRGLDLRTRAEIFLAAGEAARALGDIDRSEALARRVLSMHGGNLLEIIASAERLQALLLLDKGKPGEARAIAREIDKLHVIRPHAETLLSGQEDSVSIATHLVIAEIELADGHLSPAISSVEHALARVDKEYSDKPIFRDTYNALVLMKHLVMGCAGDSRSMDRLVELESDWSDNTSISARVRARLAVLLEAADPGLRAFNRGTEAALINPSEAARWRQFRLVLNSPALLDTGSKSHAQPVDDKEQAEEIQPPEKLSVASSTPVGAQTDDEMLLEIEGMIDDALGHPKAATPTAGPGAVATQASFAELELPDFDELPTPQAAQVTAPTPVADLVVRLDMVPFDIIIQGLERSAHTGHLDLQFDAGTMGQALAEGAKLDDIPDLNAVVGGSLFLCKGLLVDARLTYAESLDRAVDPNASLALLAQVSIGYAAAVQSSFTRTAEGHVNRFGAANNTALLLSILAKADEGSLVSPDRGDSVLTLDTPGRHLAAADVLVNSTPFPATEAEQISPYELLNIVNSASPDELCRALASALRASSVELRYKDEVIAAVGLANNAEPPINTTYGELSLNIRLISDLAPRTFTEREQALVELAYNRLFAMPRVERSSDTAATADQFPDDIIARSISMVELFRDVRKLAQWDGSDLPMAHILITGETGSGKEIVAKMIHACSSRHAAPFIPVNTVTISDELAAATIFGAMKGSYTGADKDRRGLIEAAAGGTLFLDEIGNTTEKLQAMLLRVAQDASYQRVGDTDKKNCDVRFVMATNQNIDDPARFKVELKHRFQVIPVPPLRARREDIRPLAEYFSRHNKVTLNESAFLWLERQDWPGNVRELGHFIQRAAAQAGAGATINLQALRAIAEQPSGYDPPLPPLLANESYRDALNRIEQGYLKLVLAEHPNNMNQAARLFGLARNTFLNRLSAHKINPEK